jgi:hypothetical protein
MKIKINFLYVFKDFQGRRGPHTIRTARARI